jgi:hypothetical protein
MHMSESCALITHARQTKHYVNIPVVLLEQLLTSDLSKKDIGVYLTIYRLTNGSSECRPMAISASLIAKHVQSPQRVVSRSLAKLIEAGWLHRFAASSGGCARTCPSVPSKVASLMKVAPDRLVRQTSEQGPSSGRIPKSKTSGRVSPNSSPADNKESRHTDAQAEAPHIGETCDTPQSTLERPDTSEIDARIEDLSSRLAAAKALEKESWGRGFDELRKAQSRVMAIESALKAAKAERDKAQAVSTRGSEAGPSSVRQHSAGDDGDWSTHSVRPATPTIRRHARAVIDAVYASATPPSLPKRELEQEVLYSMTQGTHRGFIASRAAAMIRRLIESGAWRTPIHYGHSHIARGRIAPGYASDAPAHLHNDAA